MNAKLLFRSSAGMLFFLLLFSKPYIARCQNSTSDNKPVMKEVRIEIDSTIDANGNVNAKKTIFIDGKEMPADFEWVEVDAPNGANVQKEIILITKEVETKKHRRHRHGKQQETEVIEIVE